jgi:hypothetical protein
MISFRYSVRVGTAGNVRPSAASSSLGTWVSTTPWTGGNGNDLFDDLSPVDNSSHRTDFRCLFVINESDDATLADARAYVSSAQATIVAIAADPTPHTALGEVEAQALTAINTNAPGPAITRLPFTLTSNEAGLPLGDIPPGHAKAFWVRRTAINSTSPGSRHDHVKITVAGHAREIP